MGNTSLFLCFFCFFVPLYFGSLAIGIICIVLAIFNADDSGGTIGGGGLPWRL